MQDALTTDAIDEIILALRAGATLSTPGSRCHSTWGLQDGQWYREDFDEGAVSTQSASENEVRELLAIQPAVGVDLLRQRRWTALREALEANEVAEALAALAAWRAFGGGVDRAQVIAAWLSPAAAIEDAPTRAALRQMFADGTLFHLFMDLHGWPQSPGSAARCLAFVDGLMARLGENVPDSTHLRQRLRERIAAEHPADRPAP